MNLIVFDLEWNMGNAPKTFNYHGAELTLRGEIIQLDNRAKWGYTCAIAKNKCAAPQRCWFSRERKCCQNENRRTP